MMKDGLYFSIASEAQWFFGPYRIPPKEVKRVCGVCTTQPTAASLTGAWNTTRGVIPNGRNHPRRRSGPFREGSYVEGTGIICPPTATNTTFIFT